MRFFFCVLATVLCSVLVLGQDASVGGPAPPPSPSGGNSSGPPPPPPGNGNGTNPGNGTGPPPSNISRPAVDFPGQNFFSQLAALLNRPPQQPPSNDGWRRPGPFFGRFQQNQQGQQGPSWSFPGRIGK